MEMKHPAQDGVVVLEGLFFFKTALIKKRPPFVEEAFRDLYQFVSMN